MPDCWSPCTFPAFAHPRKFPPHDMCSGRISQSTSPSAQCLDTYGCTRPLLDDHPASWAGEECQKEWKMESGLVILRPARNRLHVHVLDSARTLAHDTHVKGAAPHVLCWASATRGVRFCSSVADKMPAAPSTSTPHTLPGASAPALGGVSHIA